MNWTEKRVFPVHEREGTNEKGNVYMVVAGKMFANCTEIWSKAHQVSEYSKAKPCHLKWTGQCSKKTKQLLQRPHPLHHLPSHPQCHSHGTVFSNNAWGRNTMSSHLFNRFDDKPTLTTRRIGIHPYEPLPCQHLWNCQKKGLIRDSNTGWKTSFFREAAERPASFVKQLKDQLLSWSSWKTSFFCGIWT